MKEKNKKILYYFPELARIVIFVGASLLRILLFGLLIGLLMAILFFIFSCCAKVNIAETTPEFISEPAFLNIAHPNVKIWPDYFEIKAEVLDVEGTDYLVNYQYFKETKESGVEAMLSLEPINRKDKLPSKIYIHKLGKIEKVKIWGVGEYECSYNYKEMSGSVCQTAENKYKFFCAPERMNCEAIVEKILLKEPSEWL